MLMNRIYDEQDLERYNAEREQAAVRWTAVLKEASVPESLIEGFVKQINYETIVPPLVSGVEIVHTGSSAQQNFSTSMVTAWVQAGIAEIEDNTLILHARPEDLQYEIIRTPGRWCLHCAEKLSDDANGEMARLHIAMKHKGKKSPDANNPSGYEWLTYFECRLNEEQHERFRKAV